jgi:beta-glucosidase
MHVYQDCDQPIQRRVEDLLGRMTLEEKAEQLGHDAPENERLGIPMMDHGEILHGVMWWTHLAETDPERYEGVRPTVFPQTLAMGCTFDPGLIERIGAATAREARALGRHHCYSPNLDIACDSRFGRVEENFGEDPHLVTRLGVAIVNGFQGRGDERFDARHVLATAKHFTAYGLVRGGVNGSSVDAGERALREVHLPPFEAAVKEAGVAAIMPSHQAQEGIPCHANRWLLRDLLRHEWGFDGIILSDNIDIYRLYGMQHIAADMGDAAVLALRAGVDMDLVLNRNEEFMCYPLLPELVRRGRVSEREVDASVRRVLRAKFRLGLFDEPEREQARAVCCSEAHRGLALEAARSSHVLLANDGLLPLEESYLSIGLIGPHADLCEYGGYVGDLRPEGVTPAQGLRELLPDGADLLVEPGCGFGVEDDLDEGATIDRAVEAARQADVVVLALGGSRQTCGEGRDNADIRLPGRQPELARRVLACGKPTVLVLIGGRPWAVADIVERCNAVLLAWYGGCEAGRAIAESLLGRNNPGGKLSMSFPRSSGHTQCSYLHRPWFTGSGAGRYRQHENTPLFPFGHGLSYTEFSYSEPAVSDDRIGPAQDLTVSVRVTNTGPRAGDEVVQCYLSDEVASVTPFVKRLCAFRRVTLEAGETREVSFTLGPEDLAVWDVHMDKVVEPGWFTVQVGGSSAQGQTVRFAVVDPAGGAPPGRTDEAAVITREQDMEAPE